MDNSPEPSTLARDVIWFAIRTSVAVWVALLPLQLVGLWFSSPAGAAAKATAKTWMLPASAMYPVLMVAFCIYITLAVLGIISVMSGWFTLSRRYPAPKGYAEGELFSMQSAGVGIGNYNNALRIRVGPQGLYMACPFVARFMHPPILVPWTEITAARRKSYLFNSVLALTVGRPKVATISLVKKNVIAAVEPWVAKDEAS